MIAPHNIFLRDTSRYSKQQVRIAYNSSADEAVTEILYFNQTTASGDFNIQQVDLSTYRGDTNVRKLYAALPSRLQHR